MTVRVGLLGTGFIGQTHAQAYSALPDAELVAVADIDRAAADKAARDTGARALYDIESLLASDDIDLVDICLPTFLHEQCVIGAAQRGKHVLCEKPIALDLAQVDRMITALVKADVYAMVAQVIRFWPEYVAIRQQLRDGTLGDTRYIRAARLAEAPAWSSWFSDPELSGGAVLDLHIHDLDFVYSLLGRPSSLFATGIQSSAGAWDTITTTLDYGTAKAIVEATYMMPEGFPFEMGFRLLGTEGAAEYRFRVGGQVDERASAASELMLYRNGQAPKPLPCKDEDAYQAEIDYFIHCVQTQTPPTVATFAQAREVLEIALAARTSAETGQVVKL